MISLKSPLFVLLNKHNHISFTGYSNIVNTDEMKIKEKNQEVFFEKDLDFILKNQRFFQ